MTKTFALATAIALTATGAFAAGEMDTDGDGAVSFSELVAVHPDVTEETFLSIDTNADGLASEEELTAAMDAGLLPMAE